MTSRPISSRLLLVADGRTAGDGEPAVPLRRYRLARVVSGKSGGNDKRMKPRRG